MMAGFGWDLLIKEAHAADWPVRDAIVIPPHGSSVADHPACSNLEAGGVMMRSHLETTFAGFLDRLPVIGRWEYETRWFHLPNGERYLPDFWLP